MLPDEARVDLESALKNATDPLVISKIPERKNLEYFLGSESLIRWISRYQCFLSLLAN